MIASVQTLLLKMVKSPSPKDSGKGLNPHKGRSVAANRTECKICGKIFPRGNPDLIRHQAAITLKHIYHNKRKITGGFIHGCKKCDTWFTTKEHLEHHKKDSSCNENRSAATILKAEALSTNSKDKDNNSSSSRSKSHPKARPTSAPPILPPKAPEVT